MAWRKAAAVGGVVLLAAFVLLSLLASCGGSACMCPLGYVCVTVEQPVRTWRCEPSPMPPTWLAGQRDGGVEEVSE